MQSTEKLELHQRLHRNPQEWELYHTDLETLRQEWDVDPLKEPINHCSKFQGLVIGDFGCGTAQLAEALKERHTVHSFDHISINDSVVSCDIASGVPLPDESLDLAIFSLSLKGPNWKDQLV
jgi:ribosomal RNA-processing protein 8